MNPTKIISVFLLLALLLGAFASCAETKDEPDEKYDPTAGESDRAKVADDLPDDLNYNGATIDIFTRANVGELIYTTECGGSIEEGCTTVDATTYNRNQKVQTRLNVKLNWIPADSGALDSTRTQIRQILQQAEYYDFILSTNNTVLSLGLNPLLCEMTSAEYINVDKPWWWRDAIYEVSYDGTSANVLIGDINVNNYLKMSAFYFNTKLCTNKMQLEPQAFYDWVDNKTWTIEKVTTLSKGVAVVSVNGMINAFPWVEGSESTEQFFLSTRINGNLYTRNNIGYLKYQLDQNEDIVLVTEKLRDLFHETDSVSYANGQGHYDHKMIEDFANGLYYFLPQRLTAAYTTYLRDMQDDYGILPYPTLEDGDDYVTHINSSSTSICIPKVVEFENEGENLSRASAIIEALCAEAYRYTTEAFYNIALKNKYTRDDGASRMIDIIAESATKCYLHEYDSVCGSILRQITNSILEDKDVTSMLKSANDSSMAIINDFIQKTKKAG